MHIKDLKKIIYVSMNRVRQLYWDDIPHFYLKPIKPQVKDFHSSFQNTRLKETILARLRTGHTHITHGFLFDKEEPPICHHCPQHPRYTVAHFLLHCPHLHQHRHRMIQYTTNNAIGPTLPVLLGDEHPELIDILFEFIEKKISPNI